MDWTSAKPGLGKFDVVLACDVLYEEPAVVPVANLMPKLLAGGKSYFILADPEARTRAHRQEVLLFPQPWLTMAVLHMSLRLALCH